MNAVLLPLFVIWGVFALVLLFQRRIDLYLRLSAALIFLFYTALFWPDLGVSASGYQNSLRSTLAALASAFMPGLGVLLLVFWPFVILVSFYSIHQSLARGLLRIFIVLTLFYWLIQFAAPRIGVHWDWLWSRIPEKWDMPEVRKNDWKLPPMPFSKEGAGSQQNK